MKSTEPNEPYSMYGILEESTWLDGQDCELVVVCRRTGFRMPLVGFYAEADDESIRPLIGKEVSVDGDVCAIKVWHDGIKATETERSAEG